jgi:spore germination cell wall hydrolase CwlJ-like protein
MLYCLSALHDQKQLQDVPPSETTIAEQHNDSRTFSDVLKSSVAENNVPAYTNKEFMCMAKNIFFEARGTDKFEKIRVANVTMNRRNHSEFPDGVCSVVYQKKQFSWTLIKTNTIDRVDALVKRSVLERDAWNESKLVADLALSGKLKDITDGALYYHTHEVSPKWNFKIIEHTVSSEWHKFYKYKKEKS